MSKRDERGESRAQPNQRLPKGHFDSDGLSEGAQTGCVRRSPDAYQGPRPEGGESSMPKEKS
ncbi:MAG TPA: hypothetical protein VNY80_09990 [Steroidobacteraceae bacterium]|jgi:hypothetical protein|nr:hypothetical protein [Steroidobacteraceae bacterium]HWW30334.1 hypothetical protein [Steroidobacteraceae bacterium]